MTYRRLVLVQLFTGKDVSMNDLLQEIANYGFPMVIASFLLIRMDKHLESLDKGIRQLTMAIQQYHIH